MKKISRAIRHQEVTAETVQVTVSSKETTPVVVQIMLARQ